MEKFYITSPIYYVNDKPHIGHAYSTIAADVIARFHRARNKDVWFLTGTDEHGAKIAASAEAAGLAPQQFADEVSAKYLHAWEQLNVSADDFIRTTEPRHKKAVEIFLNKLKDSGKVYEGEYEGLYCVGHEAFIKESDLVDGVCPDHKTIPQQLKEKNWFFRLSDYAGELKQKIETNQLVIAPDVRRNEVLSFISQGLDDIAISRPSVKWGIAIPWDPEQTVYVWVEALFNYCSAVGYGADEEKFKKYWPADVHLMAKDIIKFHCIIWPALLSAVGEAWPKKVFAHGFFTINGHKMSKSLGNIIDPNEWVAKYGPDAVRYFLMREVPFGHDGDVSEDKLKARYEGDLANGLGNLISRVTTLIEKHLDGALPRNTAYIFRDDFSPPDDLIADYSFHEALIKIWELVAWGNKAVDENKLWELAKTDKEKFIQWAQDLILAIAQVGESLSPFMPETAGKIKAIVEAEKIVKADPLFPRIE